ncbi:hypothetical protein OV450_2679 [Actinobacteria bacterium OV450]|nr:hypothetical protein OV450_2679 [Actinobacteria bacterium OV450]
MPVRAMWSDTQDPARLHPLLDEDGRILPEPDG